MKITLATKEDITKIYTLQKQSIHMCIAEEILEEDFAKENYIYIVAKENENVIGYLLLSFVLEDADIISTAVAKEYRGQNIFAELLSFGERKLKEINVEKIFLEVRESNSSAISAYTKNNFIKIAVRRNYYKNPVENAVIMEKNIY